MPWLQYVRVIQFHVFRYPTHLFSWPKWSSFSDFSNLMFVDSRAYDEINLYWIKFCQLFTWNVIQECTVYRFVLTVNCAFRLSSTSQIHRFYERNWWRHMRCIDEQVVIVIRFRICGYVCSTFIYVFFQRFLCFDIKTLKLKHF